MKTKLLISFVVIVTLGVSAYFAKVAFNPTNLFTINVDALCNGEYEDGTWVPDHRDDFGGMICCVHDNGFCSWIDCNDY